MSAVRLDKYLAQSGERTRSQAARAVRDGLVQVNGATVRDPAVKVGEGDEVTLAGQPVRDSALQYFMLHKPAGVLTAARDGRAQTVMDLVPPALLRRRVLPVGRLDKDTTGLLLLTNDGPLAHRLLSPRHHVDKSYFVRVDGALGREDAEAFAAGMTLADGLACLPAGLELLDTPDAAIVTLREGKYHQIKRMLAARGKPVVYLKRLTMGPLSLDPALEKGEWRPLTAEELAAIRSV